jgi:antitoxin VapB
VAADELDKIALPCAALPVLDQRNAREIVGYDENGLPDSGGGWEK